MSPPFEVGPPFQVDTPLDVAPPRGGGVIWGVVSTLGSFAGRGGGLVWIGIMGGISAAVSVFHVPKFSLSLDMASSWLWCAVDRALWMAQDRNFRAWMMRYSGVSVGWLT